MKKEHVIPRATVIKFRARPVFFVGPDPFPLLIKCLSSDLAWHETTNPTIVERAITDKRIKTTHPMIPPSGVGGRSRKPTVPPLNKISNKF